MSSWSVSYTRRALKDLAGIDRMQVARIRQFLEQRLDAADPRSNGTALVGENLWRYRVGDYRILCQLQDPVLVVLVVRVAHRREAYRT